MKMLAAVVVLASGCAGSFGGSSSSTTEHHTRLRASDAVAVGDVALLTLDALQSRDMTRYYPGRAVSPMGYYLAESNPLLGRTPSKTELTVYCGVWAVAVVAASRFDNRLIRYGIPAAVMAFEIHATIGNYQNGERPQW